MKCRLTEKRNMTIMLVVGLILAAAGVVVALWLPESSHTATRMAGVCAGAGTSLAMMGGGMLLWRRQIGEVRARDSELGMADERGQTIALKAQNVFAMATTAALVLLILAATVRGDLFYMGLTGALTMVCALAKGVAWRIYEKRM